MKKRLLAILVTIFGTFMFASAYEAAKPSLNVIRTAHKYVDKPTLIMEDSLKHIFFFEGKRKGFAIVDAQGSLLGYSHSAITDDGKSLPYALKQMLEHYSRYEVNVSQRAASHIPKQLETPSFDQGKPFNGQLDGNLVGCTGIAMATIMKYYNWPPKGRGRIDYQTDDNKSYSCDFNSLSFNWDDILNSYAGAYTNVQAESVATLSAAAAMSVNTFFDTNGSSSNARDVPNALKEYFYFDKGTYLLYASEMSPAAWEERLRNEIDNNRPVIYFGAQEDSNLYLDGRTGHAFVIDGYDEYGLFHINWGWGGTYDGYFALTSLQPTAQQDFSYGAGAVFGILPDYKMEDPEKVVVYLSSYHPGHIDGMISNTEYVKLGKNVSISNFCWKVNGEPFTRLMTAVAHCDGAGNIKNIYCEKDFNEASLEFQTGGFQGSESFTAKEDAVEGDYLCMVYKGNDMQEWKVMGTEGPVRNYCPAYGYVVPKIPVTWKNIQDFDIKPEFDSNDERYINGIVSGQYWTVFIYPKKNFAHYHILINGSNRSDYFKQEFKKDIYGDVALSLQCVKDVPKHMNFEMEIVALTSDQINTNLLTIAGVTPGKLEEMLCEVALPESVSKLKLQGQITDSDFDFMREKMFVLEELDLKEVTIAGHDYNPEGYLPYKAFEDKYSLKKITLPENIIGFHNNALSNTGIESIFIPSSAVNFGLNIFNSCQHLYNVTIAQETPPFINWCVFNGVPRADATLVVPAGAKEKYAANTEWGQFGNIVEDDSAFGGVDSIGLDGTTDFFISNNTIYADKECTVYDVSGQFVGKGKKIRIARKGLYILHCGDNSFKISL